MLLLLGTATQTLLSPLYEESFRARLEFFLHCSPPCPFIGTSSVLWDTVLVTTCAIAFILRNSGLQPNYIHADMVYVHTNNTSYSYSSFPALSYKIISQNYIQTLSRLIYLNAFAIAQAVGSVLGSHSGSHGPRYEWFGDCHGWKW